MARMPPLPPNEGRRGHQTPAAVIARSAQRDEAISATRVDLTLQVQAPMVQWRRRILAERTRDIEQSQWLIAGRTKSRKWNDHRYPRPHDPAGPAQHHP